MSGRRLSDKILLAFVTVSLFVHGMTYAMVRGAIKASQERAARWEKKLEVAGQNDDALADQLGLLQKEFNLFKQQEELHSQQLQAVLEKAKAGEKAKK